MSKHIRNSKTEIVIAIIGATAVIVAACIGLGLPIVQSWIDSQSSAPNALQTPSATRQSSSIAGATSIPFTPIAFTPTPANPDTIPNLVNNGFFTERYDGWIREIVDEGGSSKTEIIPFASSNFGTAIHIQHEGEGGVYFYQDIAISSIDLDFSATFKAHSEEGSIIGFSGTGVSQIALRYFDATDNLLGETIIYNYVKNGFAGGNLLGAPERVKETNALHFIDVESDKLYKNFKIDIRQEIEDNLVMIRPEQVKKISIFLSCAATDTQAKSELTVADLILSER